MSTKPAESVVVELLTDDERVDRDRLERVVQHGVRAFLEVGRALAEIQRRRLYRETHSRFEKYLVERFDLRHSHAHQLIGAHKVMEALSATAEILPTNERQIRPLLKFVDKPAKLVEKWGEAVRTAPVDDNGVKLPITGKHVEAVTRTSTTATRRRRLDPASVLASVIQSIEVDCYALERVADQLDDPVLEAVTKLSKLRSRLSTIINAIGKTQGPGAA